MRRAFHIALAAVACAAGTEAAAQFRETPMVLYAPGIFGNVVPYAFDATVTESDLLVLYSSQTMSTSPYRRHHDMLTSLASPVARPSAFESVAAGRLAQNASDALTDVAYGVGVYGAELQIAFGNEQQPPPGILRSFSVPLTPGSRATIAHLIPRAADFVIVPHNTGQGREPALAGEVYAVDFDAAGASTRFWHSEGRLRRFLVPEEVLTMRIGAAARSFGVDDLYLPGQGSVQIYENRWPPASPPPAPGLADIVLGDDLGNPVLVDATGKVPAGINGDCQGAAPLDVDSDGYPDLVVTLSSFSRYGSIPAGHLLWIKGTGTVSAFASGAWADLNPELGLVDPVVARPLQIDGQPAAAVWDRGLGEVVVIRSDAVAHRPVVAWRGTTAGRHVKDIRLADVVGSPAPDLVADGTDVIEEGYPYAPPAILVYPDLGDSSPLLAWAAGSPGTPERGEDHAMAVVATDPDVPAGQLRVEWILGDPWFGTVVWTGSDYVHPGSSLCGTPPQTLPVTVRAIDELGVFAEVGAVLDVSETPPTVAISGAVPPDRLSLPPGGATFAVEGAAWSQCSVSFAWGVSPPWPPGANVSTTGGAGTTVQTVDLPEAAYPGLLAAAAPEVTLTATDGSVPLTASTTLQLQVDATRLVDVALTSDLATIREGEVAVLETRISSHVGVELPSVHVVHVLAGLVAAGDPEADEADVVETLAGGTEVVLDALPPAGQDVVVRLPVRSAGGRAASAVEVRSSGGHLLTPAAAVPVEASPMPGCGCGSSPAGGALALAALVALRRRARTRPSPG